MLTQPMLACLLTVHMHRFAAVWCSQFGCKAIWHMFGMLFCMAMHSVSMMGMSVGSTWCQVLMQIGQMTPQPIKTQFGYHLILCEGRKQ